MLLIEYFDQVQRRESQFLCQLRKSILSEVREVQGEWSDHPCHYPDHQNILSVFLDAPKRIHEQTKSKEIRSDLKTMRKCFWWDVWNNGKVLQNFNEYFFDNIQKINVSSDQNKIYDLRLRELLPQPQNPSWQVLVLVF